MELAVSGRAPIALNVEAYAEREIMAFFQTLDARAARARPRPPAPAQAAGAARPAAGGGAAGGGAAGGGAAGGGAADGGAAGGGAAGGGAAGGAQEGSPFVAGAARAGGPAELVSRALAAEGARAEAWLDGNGVSLALSAGRLLFAATGDAEARAEPLERVVGVRAARGGHEMELQVRLPAPRVPRRARHPGSGPWVV
jgi:hypothetical protein